MNRSCAPEDAGLRCVYIPEANWQERYVERSIQVVPVRSLVQCIELVFSNPAMAIPSGLG